MESMRRAVAVVGLVGRYLDLDLEYLIMPLKYLLGLIGLVAHVLDIVLILLLLIIQQKLNVSLHGLLKHGLNHMVPLTLTMARQ